MKTDRHFKLNGLPYLIILVFVLFPASVSAAPSSISCNLSHFDGVVLGESFSVFGSISPTPGEPNAFVTIEFMPTTGSPITRTTNADVNGDFYYDVECGIISHTGEWLVRTSWEGDQLLDPDTSGPAPLSAYQADSLLTVDVSSPVVVIGNQVTISGKFTPIPDCGADLSGLSITVYIEGQGETYPHNVLTDSSGNFILQTYSGLDLLGQWYLSAEFEETYNYAGSWIDYIFVRVVESIGYAVIAVGSESTNPELLEAHTKTANNVYTHLVNRGFALSLGYSDPLDNIKYLNPYDVSQTGEDPYTDSYKETIRRLFVSDLPVEPSWAFQKMSAARGPLYVILTGPGSINEFHLTDTETITSQELNTWMEDLENDLSAAGIEDDIVIIVGSDHSGSLVDELSKTGRVVVTSSAYNEVSYQGSVEPVVDAARDGDLFISNLFNYLGNGWNLKNSFQKAVERTETFTHSNATVIQYPWFDNAVQHPLLDDDGDNVGTNDFSTSDGNQSWQILGADMGVDIVQIDPDNFGSIPVIPLSPTENSALMWAQVIDDPANQPNAASVWAAIRTPGIVLPNAAEPSIVSLIEMPLIWSDANSRYEAVYAGFTDSGKYTIFYYVKNTNGVISPFERSFVYKSKVGNNPPAPFSLTYPSQEVTLDCMGSKGFDWEDSVDPDDDAINYTFELRQGSWANGVTVFRKGEIGKSVFILTPDNYQLMDVLPYTWRVFAVDRNGAETPSEVWSFHSDAMN